VRPLPTPWATDDLSPARRSPPLPTPRSAPPLVRSRRRHGVLAFDAPLVELMIDPRLRMGVWLNERGDVLGRVPLRRGVGNHPAPHGLTADMRRGALTVMTLVILMTLACAHVSWRRRRDPNRKTPIECLENYCECPPNTCKYPDKRPDPVMYPVTMSSTSSPKDEPPSPPPKNDFPGL
jgi:hypothetical protein